MKMIKKAAALLLSVLLLGLCGCGGESAQITQEELNEVKLSALQTIFSSAEEFGSAEDIISAAEQLGLFTFVSDNTVYVVKRAIVRPPAGSSDPFVEFIVDGDDCIFAHYRSDFESADAYYYLRGEWMGLNETAEGEYSGCYVVNQPDTFIDGDRLLSIPAGGGAAIEFICFDSARDAILRLQSVHILLA